MKRDACQEESNTILGITGLTVPFSPFSLKFPLSKLQFFARTWCELSCSRQHRGSVEASNSMIKALNIKFSSPASLQKFQRSLAALLWIDVALGALTV